MKQATKTTQLQIRVSPAQKAQLNKAAQQAGLSLSNWMLQQALPAHSHNFSQRVEQLANKETPRNYLFAEIADFLRSLNETQLIDALAREPNIAGLDAYCTNYLAAMIEQQCSQKKCLIPAWVKSIQPLPTPQFYSELKSIRLHLLKNSLPTFRNRNIFVDASIEARV